MPPPQQQVIYLPQKRDTTALGAEMLVHALQQMTESIRQNKLDAIAAEQLKRKNAAEDIATQQRADAELSQLAPQTSMYEAAPPVEIPAPQVPGQEDLGLSAGQAQPPTDLGMTRLRAPLTNEITLANGKKFPIAIRPTLEETQTEARVGKADAANEALQQLLQKTTIEEGVKAKFREPKAPTTQNVGGRLMGWNPETKKFDLDFGPSGTPKDTSAVDAARASAASARDAARADRSFQYNDAQLERLAKPYNEQAARMDRLVATVDQRTPQADALIAPELLTVMAGGQGSGLRMNEAEIARIIGGRSKLEGLKASLNKWKLDPSQALSITDAQRAQIKSLISEVRIRGLKAQDLIDTASQSLVSADNVEAHRKIVSDLRTNLRKLGTPDVAADGAGAVATTTTPVPTLPQVGEVKRGYRFKGGDPSQPASWEKVQ